MNCHRFNNLSPQRAGHAGGIKPHGVSKLPVRFACSTLTPAPDRNEPEGEASSGASPSKTDIAFAAVVFAAFATVAFAFYAVGALGEWLARRWQAARRWMQFHYQCAWCGGHMGGNRLAQISHGICPQCLAQQKQQVTSSALTPHRTMTVTNH